MRINFFIMIGTFFMYGCAGIQVTTCVSNPSKMNFKCINHSKNKELNLDPSKVDNWIFFSSADWFAYLDACENRRGGVKVNACAFGYKAMSFTCFNEVTGQSNGFTYVDSENYIGVSAVDEEILLNYCASLKR